MSTESDLRLWRDRIARGLSAQKKYARTDHWSTYEDYYLGNHGRNVNLYVNYLFGLCRSQIPMIYFRNPRISVSARHQAVEGHAPVLESVDNWMIQEIGIKQQWKLIPYDNFLYGISILKFGYDSEYGFDEKQLMQPVMAEQGVADLSNETLSQRVKNGIKRIFRSTKQARPHDFDLIEYDDRVQSGMPWVLRWHPADFIIEPGASCVEDAQWCAFRVFRKLEDIQADAKYEHTQNLKPGFDEEYFDRSSERRVAEVMPSKTDPDDIEDRGEPRRDEWVELWELHDKKDQTIQVSARNHDKFLRHERDALQIDGLPVLAVSFNRNPKTFWGIPDARMLQPLQDELNRVTSLQEEYLKHNCRRLLTPVGLFNATQKAMFMADTPVSVIEIEGLDMSKPIKEQIVELQGFVPPDLAQRAEQLRADMREIIGLGRNQLGEWNRGMEGGAGRGTATEAQIVQQNASIRVDERRDILADALSRTIRKLNQMIFKWWTAPKVVRIVGQQGMNWKQYTGVALRGEYDYVIEPDDALPMTRDRRRNEAIALFERFAQDPYVDPIEMRKWVFEQFEGANGDRLMKPPDQAQQPGQAELQMAQMQLQMQAQQHQQQMQMAQQKHQQEMQMAEEKHDQEMRIAEEKRESDRLMADEKREAAKKDAAQKAAAQKQAAKAAKKESKAK